MSQLLAKISKAAQAYRSREARKRFLYAYEKTLGNISKSCEYAGISRKTYYRWMQSNAPANKRFRDKVELMRPRDYLLDLVEAELLVRIQSGKCTDSMLMFALKQYGKDRGYT